MATLRAMAVTGDVQNILFERNFLENDLNNAGLGSANVEEFLDTSMDDINAVLITIGYTLPILVADSPYGYWYCRHMNAVCAAAQTERRAGGTAKADELEEQCKQMKDDLLNHVILLTDVAGVPTLAALSDSETSELTEAGEEREAFFTRDQNF